MLRPRSGAGQWIVSERYEVTPLSRAVEYVDVFGNLGQRLVMPQGKLTLDLECVVECDDHIATAPDAPYTPVDQLPDDVLHYLVASRYCPSDMTVSQAREITAGVGSGYAKAEAIRAWIEKNIEYKRAPATSRRAGSIP